MKMTDSILIRRRGSTLEEQLLQGVYCSETRAMQSETVGYKADGRLVVRIPEKLEPELRCGDQICRMGSKYWYTVAEIYDNRQACSRLSHWKIIGKR